MKKKTKRRLEIAALVFDILEAIATLLSIILTLI